MKVTRFIAVSIAAGLWSLPLAAQAPPLGNHFAKFSADIDALRTQLRVPGLAAGVVEDGHLVWRANFGFADVAHRLPVVDSTEFAIASVSKTFAAVVLMQLVQERKLRLDDPINKYVPDSGMPANVTIREVMSHTSDNVPGEEFVYNGARYARLSRVIEAVAGRPYAAVLSERILRPLGMTQTIPGLGDPAYSNLQRNMANPYRWDMHAPDGIAPGDLPRPGLRAATGIVSTVGDLALYAAGLDDDTVISTAAKAAMFTPTRSSRGEALPYGLGWFVQTYDGQHLIWHYGQEDSYASLFVRLPAYRATLIMLANSNALSDAFRLLDGNAARSPLVLYFLRDIVSVAQHPRIAIDRDIDQALANVYLGQRGPAIATIAGAFAVETQRPAPDLSTLYLFTQLNDPRFSVPAQAMGRTILAQHPNLASALFYLGTLYEQAGRVDQAIPLFERIASLRPPLRQWPTALALIELGKYYSGRDPARARQDLQRVVDLGIDSEEASRLLRALPARP